MDDGESGSTALVMVRVRQAICGFRGHDAVLHFEAGRMSLVCTSCLYSTPGWDLRGDEPRTRLGVQSDAVIPQKSTAESVCHGFAPTN